MVEFSAEQFAQRVLDFNLLDARQLDAAWAELGTRSASLGELRSLLVRRELLTNYQADRILRGERSGYYYGRHKVLYLIGAGSFARVYRAVHADTGQIVALKVLRSRHSKDPDRRESFLREGEMGAGLQHPNIVPIYEVHAEGTAPYLVIEFVEGQSLRDFVRVRRKLEPLEAATLMADIAAGLAYAFERGVTHRDLKLSNVLISSSRQARLIDFGLAAVSSKLTEENVVDCPNDRTIDYAGLERATGVRKDDPRSDIYFAGCIFYNMLCGEPPLFETKDRVQRLSITRFQDVVPLNRLMPNLPHHLVQIVNRAMELNPKQRYSTPREMLAELRDAVRRLTRHAEEGSAPDDEALDAARHKIMIVDSNVGMQNILREKLKSDGYRVLVISDPARAIARFEAEEAAADVVIFSCHELADDALEAFQRFAHQNETRDVPAILLLGEKQQSWRTQVQLAEHRVALTMPIRLKELREALRTLLQPRVA